MRAEVQLNEWSEYMRAVGASPATIRIRTETIKILCRHADVTDPAQLTRKHVLAFLGRSIKQWTKVTYYRSIKSWDTWALEFDEITDSIVRGIPSPRQPPGAARPISDETVSALLAAPMSSRAKAYVLLALYAGLRVHEIAKIRAEDFDLDSGWLMVTGKGGTTSPIPVHPKLLELAMSMPEVGPWFPSRGPTGHVKPQAVSLTIKNVMASVGCPATAHQLRDTAATNFQRQVKDIRLTQALLRHRNITSTMKYTAVSDSALKAAVNNINWDDAA